MISIQDNEETAFEDRHPDDNPSMDKNLLTYEGWKLISLDEWMDAGGYLIHSF